MSSMLNDRTRNAGADRFCRRCARRAFANEYHRQFERIKRGRVARIAVMEPHDLADDVDDDVDGGGVVVIVECGRPPPSPTLPSIQESSRVWKVILFLLYVYVRTPKAGNE